MKKTKIITSAQAKTAILRCEGCGAILKFEKETVETVVCGACRTGHAV